MAPVQPELCDLHPAACLQVEARTGWPFQGSGNSAEPVYSAPRGRFGRACAKLVKPGNPEVEQARGEIQHLRIVVLDQTRQMDLLRALRTDAEAASRHSADELTSAVADRDSAVSNCAQAEHASQRLQQEVIDLQQQLCDTVSASEAARAEQATASDQAAQAHSNLMQSAAELTELAADRDAAESSRNHIQLQNTGLQGTVDNLQQQLYGVCQALAVSQAEQTATDVQLAQTQQSRRVVQEQLSAQQASTQSLSDSLGGAQTLVTDLQKQLSTASDASAYELQAVQGHAEGLGQELASVKEQVRDASRERDEQVAGRQQAPQESQQLRKALQEQEDAVKTMEGGAEQDARALEQAGQNIQHLQTDFDQAAARNAGMPTSC